MPCPVLLPFQRRLQFSSVQFVFSSFDDVQKCLQLPYLTHPTSSSSSECSLTSPAILTQRDGLPSRIPPSAVVLLSLPHHQDFHNFLCYKTETATQERHILNHDIIFKLSITVKQTFTNCEHERCSTQGWRRFFFQFPARVGTRNSAVNRFKSQKSPCYDSFAQRILVMSVLFSWCSSFAYCT